MSYRQIQSTPSKTPQGLTFWRPQCKYTGPAQDGCLNRNPNSLFELPLNVKCHQNQLEKQKVAFGVRKRSSTFGALLSKATSDVGSPVLALPVENSFRREIALRSEATSDGKLSVLESQPGLFTVKIKVTTWSSHAFKKTCTASVYQNQNSLNFARFNSKK